MNPRKRALISEFKSIVRNICSAHDIQMLAEEFNEEARQNSRVDRTVLENIAVEFDIGHCFIEPGLEERARRNVKSEDHDLREEIWLEKLAPYLGTEMILVCGQTHVPTFSSKLSHRNMPFEIIREGLGVDEGSISIIFHKGITSASSETA